MKKLIPIAIILVALVSVASYYGYYIFSKEPTSTSSDKSVADIPENWQKYVNATYGFHLSHPSDWEVQEALKPQELRAEHEVVVWERDYDMWRGSATVRIFQNEKHQTVREWWNTWLADEDVKEAECREEYGDESPCLFLRGLVEWEKETTLAGEKAITVGLFRFDHEGECIYAAQGEYVFGFCAPGANNPNDPKAAQHTEITNLVRDTFKLIGS